MCYALRMDKLDEYYLYATWYVNKNAETQRFGQCLMNALADFDTEAYHAIVGTDADPFYDDAKANAFGYAIEERWK